MVVVTGYKGEIMGDTSHPAERESPDWVEIRWRDDLSHPSSSAITADSARELYQGLREIYEPGS
jgi:hypothetical protein